MSSATSVRMLVLAGSLIAVPACHGKTDKPASTGSAKGPTPTPPQAPTAAAGKRITLHATLTLTGTVAGTATFTQTSNDWTSCANYASTQDHFELPRADEVRLSSGQKVDLSDSPEHYHGPGTYGASDLDQASATLSINDSDEPYQPMGKDATHSLTINADGSGTYTLTNWHDPGSGTVSGTLTWTCSASS